MVHCVRGLCDQHQNLKVFHILMVSICNMHNAVNCYSILIEFITTQNKYAISLTLSLSLFLVPFGVFFLWALKSKANNRLGWTRHTIFLFSYKVHSIHFTTIGVLCKISLPIRLRIDFILVLSFQLFLLFLFFSAKTNKDGKLEICKPIHKVDLRTTKMGWVLIWITR